MHINHPRDRLFFLATFDHGFIGPVVDIYHRVQTFEGHFDLSHAAWKGCVAGLFRRRKAFPPADGPWPVLLFITPRYTRVFPFERNWLFSGLDFAVRQVHVDRPRDRLFLLACDDGWVIGPVVNVHHRVQTFGGHFDLSHAAWKGRVAGLFRRRKAFPPADGPWPVLLLLTPRYTRVFPFERNWLRSGLHFTVRQVHVNRPRDCLFFLAFYYCWFVWFIGHNIFIFLFKQEAIQIAERSACRLNLLFIFSGFILILVINFIIFWSVRQTGKLHFNSLNWLLFIV